MKVEIKQGSTERLSIQEVEKGHWYELADGTLVHYQGIVKDFLVFCGFDASSKGPYLILMNEDYDIVFKPVGVEKVVVYKL